MKKLFVSRNQDGRLELFGIGTEDGIWHNWQIAPNNGWRGWHRLGTSNDRGKNIAVGQNQDGRLEVFVIGMDDGIWHNWQTAPNNGWSGWHRLGTSNDRGKSIAVGQNQDGRLEVFVIGIDDGIWHNWQTAPNNRWSGWHRLGTPSNKGKSIAVGQNQDGRLEVFVIGMDDGIWHNWQTAPNNGWSGWHRLGTPSNKGKSIALGKNQDGRLEVFTVGTNDNIYHFWQLVPNGGWSSEDRLGTADNKAKGLVVGQNQDGRLEVFTIGTNDRVYHFWQKVHDGWSDEHTLPFCLGINLILVGVEGFTNADIQEVRDAVETTRDIYSNVGLAVDLVEWYQITNAQAGGFTVINSNSEATDLTEDWTVRNDLHDVFVVRSMNGADGWSAVNGSCDKDGKGMTGSVVSLNGNPANSGNTFAHEIGHYLGLSHIADNGNFIGGNGSSNSWTGIHGWQGDVMKGHCFVRK